MQESESVQKSHAAWRMQGSSPSLPVEVARTMKERLGPGSNEASNSIVVELDVE